MILHNANVLDPESKRFIHANVQIREGKIARISSASPGADEAAMDLQGGFLLPAFCDAHLHVLGLGQRLHATPWDASWDERQFSDWIDRQEESFLEIRGWGGIQDRFLPSFELLERWKEKAIVLVRRCGHVALVNRRAISLLELGSGDGIDGTDLSKGVVREKAMHMLKKGNNSSEFRQLCFQKAIRELNRWGICSVHSDDFAEFSALEQMASLFSQQQGVRIFQKVHPPSFSWLRGSALPVSQGWGNTGFLQLRSIKLFLDGSLGARTALLQAPYSDEPHTRGVAVLSAEELEDFVSFCERKGITMCMHVIGDGALETALQVLAKRGDPTNPLRHRLIHAQNAWPDQIARIQKSNLLVSIQPAFFDSDRFMAPERLGAERYAQMAYPFSQMLERGIPLSLSTDAPVEEVNPFATLGSALRFMDMGQAFDLYTCGGAFASFSETQRGTIAPGMDADLMVLDQDLWQMQPQELRDVHPLAVFTGGKQVFPV